MRRIDTSRSSNLKSLEYDGTNLIAEFANGSVYQYMDVPNELFEAFEKLQESESFGRYFIANVRGKFEFKKIKDSIKVHK